MSNEIEQFQPLEAELLPAEVNANAPMPLDHQMFKVAQMMPDRDLKAIEKRIIYEASQKPEDMTYQWSLRGGGIVKGPTVKLANIIFRNWGMMGAHAEIAHENSREWVYKYQIVDFKTITIFPPRFFTQRKSQTAGSGMEADRAQDIASQIGQSKGSRNAYLNALPSYIVDAAIKACEKASLGKIREMGLEKAIARSVTFLAEKGIGEDRIVAKYKKPLDEFLDSDVLALWNDCGAITEGVISATAAFPEPKDDEPKPEKKPAKKAAPKKAAPKKAAAKKEPPKEEPPRANKPETEPPPEEVDLFDDNNPQGGGEEEEPLPEPPGGEEPTKKPEADSPASGDDDKQHQELELVRTDLEGEFGVAEVTGYLKALEWKPTDTPEQKAQKLQLCRAAFEANKPGE